VKIETHSCASARCMLCTMGVPRVPEQLSGHCIECCRNAYLTASRVSECKCTCSLCVATRAKEPR
jgi:hypothetical protein